MSHRISPPSLKRVRHQSRGFAANTTAVGFPDLHPLTPGTLRIFSWNVNGIAPFVEPYLQTNIKSFFNSAEIPSSTTGRKREKAIEYDGENDDPSKEGKPSLRLALKRCGWPHMLFLQEVKIKPGDTRTMNAVTRATNDDKSASKHGSAVPMKADEAKQAGVRGLQLGDGGPEYDVYFNLPSDPYNAKGFGGKVYGVVAIIRKDFSRKYVEKVRGVPWDREGRVQVVETRGMTFPLDALSSASVNAEPDEASPRNTEAEENSSSATDHGIFKFAIIHVYAVNGTDNLYRSPSTGSVVGTRHDRKLAVHTELLREAKALESKGYQVIIAGDLNIARNELDGYPNLRTRPHQHVLNRADFNEKFFTDNSHSRATYGNGPDLDNEKAGNIQGFNGIDTFRHVHGNERRYSYYPRGREWGTSCDRVDLIIASRALSGQIASAGICDSPRDRGPSDHCPIWVEIGQPRKLSQVH
ncbi:hypothetical protein AAE478_004435 [Parahypoxylon ruwenzoriense]